MREEEFFNKYMLNEEQTQALKQTEGAVLVTAGAGSGKTRLLTHRIAYLMSVLNVPARRILAITFTNKAASEMKDRVVNMIAGGGEVWISTFHSMCARILRSHIEKLGGNYDRNFTIYSDSDCDKLLKEIFDGHNITDDKFKKSVKYHISNCKNSDIGLERYQLEHSYEPEIAEIMSCFREYENKLKSNNALDFDDLLIKCQTLLSDHKDVLDYYADRFEYVLVDEFQDTNKVQFELVKLLASKHKNIFVVGDEDQCIYTWRGASFKNIYDFEKNFSSVKVFKLERNYRSCKQIVDMANKVIGNNTLRFKKTLWTDIDGDDCIEYNKPYNEKEEAEFIARKIHNLVQSGEYQYGDFAILMRLNALTLPFEEKLLSYNIPHRIYGGFKFFERQEIKNVIAYLRLFVNPKDDVSFLRVINFPKRGIGNSAIATLTEMAKDNNSSLLEMCLKLKNFSDNDAFYKKFSGFVETYISLVSDFEHLSLSDFVRELVSRFQVKFAYMQKEEDIEKSMNIDALINSIDEFSSSNEMATLTDFLENVSLISDIDTMDNSSTNVTIATVHSVKGLEFRVVFLVGLEETIFPLSRALEKPAELEEERRLMYVAITRAKEKLFLSNCNVRFLYGRQSYMMPSRFLAEAGVEEKRDYNSKFAYSKTSMPQKFDVIKPQASKIESEIPKQKNDISKFKVGQLVMHPKFGVGTIEAIDNNAKFVDIVFSGFGKKTLLVEIAPLKIIKG